MENLNKIEFKQNLLFFLGLILPIVLMLGISFVLESHIFESLNDISKAFMGAVSGFLGIAFAIMLTQYKSNLGNKNFLHSIKETEFKYDILISEIEKQKKELEKLSNKDAIKKIEETEIQIHLDKINNLKRLLDTQLVAEL